MANSTRTFLREAGGARQFLEISWSGPEVETVTGRVGAAGRAQTTLFETAEERDVWVAKRVAKALREGYAEGSPADVSAQEPADDNADRSKAERLRARHALPTYLPVFVPAFLPVSAVDDAREASKLGGTPWLDGPWPLCPGCTKPLRFFLQLRRDELPASCRWAFRADLLQLFLCDAEGKPGNPEWLCQADGCGWEPFAPSTLVRHLAISAGPTDVAVAHQAGIFPPARVARWEEQIDVPVYGDLESEEVDLLKNELGLVCCHLHKLAGAPAWAQDPEVPSCRACGTTMRHLFQITSADPIRIGGDGIGWLFVCPGCLEGTFAWQR